MAEGVQITCTECDFTIEAWSDGNPYYLDEHGEKRYAYHPSPDADRCTAVDVPHICMKCAHEFNVDSAAPIRLCPECNFGRISSLWRLAGKTCPRCKSGEIVAGGWMIS